LQNIVLAQVLIYLKRPDPAIALLSRSLEISKQNKRFLWTVRALIWQAVAFYKKQLIKEAFDSLEQALDLAEPNEMIRSFVNSDPCVAILLGQLKTRPLPKSRVRYINLLLETFEQTNLSNNPTTPPSPVEPLTERELEILKLLESGLTNKELAAKLIISVGTVAWHLKNLYAKLAVRNRTEAISRAKELNLI
jgi:LuxR family maltose regulon positive regulatory protein